MAAVGRAFRGGPDYEAVSEFLVSLHEPESREGNWLQPVWKYANTHPWFDEASSARRCWPMPRSISGPAATMAGGV